MRAEIKGKTDRQHTGTRSGLGNTHQQPAKFRTATSQLIQSVATKKLAFQRYSRVPLEGASMSDPLTDTAAALRAKAERCTRFAWYMPDDVRETLTEIASDYLERAVKVEEKQRKRDE